MFTEEPAPANIIGMEPSNQPNQMPTVTSDNNPYGFMFEDKSKKKSPGLNFKGPNRKKTWIYLGVFTLLGAILIFTIILIFGGDRGGISKLNDLTARQQEIARVSEQAARYGGKLNVRAMAVNTRALTVADQVSIKTTLGKAYDKRVINLYRDKNIDTQLKEARTAGKFDKVYGAWINTRLKEYYLKIKDVQKTSGLSKQSKTALSKSLKNTEDIIKNLPATQ